MEIQNLNPDLPIISVQSMDEVTAFGLLLGASGLAVVLLRGVWERRGELALLRALKAHVGGTGDENAIARQVRQQLEAILRLPTLAKRFAPPRSRKFKNVVEYLSLNPDDRFLWGTTFGWLAVHALGEITSSGSLRGHVESAQTSRAWLDEFLIGNALAHALRGLGLEESAGRALHVIRLLTRHQHWFEIFEGSDGAGAYLVSWLVDPEVQQFIGVHRYGGVVWFNKEAFEDLVRWMFRLQVIHLTADPLRPAVQVAQAIQAAFDSVIKIGQLEADSAYRFEDLMDSARQIGVPKYRPRGAGTRTRHKRASKPK